MRPNESRIRRPAGAADKIKGFHWAFRRRRRPHAVSFMRWLGRARDRPTRSGLRSVPSRVCGRRPFSCWKGCKEQDANRANDHNVLGTILPAHAVGPGLD